MRLLWRWDVGAGQQGAVLVARRHDDVALFAECGDVIAYQGLHFLGVESVADVGLHLFQRLQSRLHVIFDLEDFETVRV